MTRESSKRAGTTGWPTPHLQGSLGWIDGEPPQEIDGGDHVPILADVVEMTAIDTGDPLVFHGDRGRTPLSVIRLSPPLKPRSTKY